MMGTKIRPLPEMHQHGHISLENPGLMEHWPQFGDFGIQVAGDGRVWVCIDGVAFIRFKPCKRKEQT